MVLGRWNTEVSIPAATASSYTFRAWNQGVFSILLYDVMWEFQDLFNFSFVISEFKLN